jgi:hypothetical protein
MTTNALSYGLCVDNVVRGYGLSEGCVSDCQPPNRTASGDAESWHYIETCRTKF